MRTGEKLAVAMRAKKSALVQVDGWIIGFAIE